MLAGRKVQVMPLRVFPEAIALQQLEAACVRCVRRELAHRA
jgi:hypothetical protein